MYVKMHWIVTALTGILTALLGLYIGRIWHLGRERRSRGFYLFSVVLGLSFGLYCGSLVAHTGLAVLTIFFGFVLFMGATIDLKYLILPDEGALLLLISGIVRLWLIDESIVSAVVSALVVLVLGAVICKISHQSIGFGDIKWLAASLCWIPWHLLWLVLYMAFLSGSLYVIGHLLYKRLVKHETMQCIRKQKLPFAPFLCSSIFLVYIWGTTMSAWYVRFFW